MCERCAKRTRPRPEFILRSGTDSLTRATELDSWRLVQWSERQHALHAARTLMHGYKSSHWHTNQMCTIWTDRFNMVVAATDSELGATTLGSSSDSNGCQFSRAIAGAHASLVVQHPQHTHLNGVTAGHFSPAVSTAPNIPKHGTVASAHIPRSAPENGTSRPSSCAIEWDCWRRLARMERSERLARRMGRHCWSIQSKQWIQTSVQF